jgi:hypothetical protein
MVCFRTKSPNSGKFRRALEWTMMVLFIPVWNILRPFGIHTLWPFGNFAVILYIFHRFGTLL